MSEHSEQPKPIILPDGTELIYESTSTGVYDIQSYRIKGDLRFPPLRRQIDNQRKVVNAHYDIPRSGIALDINCSSNISKRRFCAIDISDGEIDAPVVHAVYKFGKLIKAKIIDAREFDFERSADYVAEDIDLYKSDYSYVTNDEIAAVTSSSSERYRELNDRTDPMAIVDFNTMKIKYYEKEKETIGVTPKEEKLEPGKRYAFFEDIYKYDPKGESIELSHEGVRGGVAVRLPKQLPFGVVDNLVDVNSQKWADYSFIDGFKVNKTLPE